MPVWPETDGRQGCDTEAAAPFLRDQKPSESAFFLLTMIRCLSLILALALPLAAQNDNAAAADSSKAGSGTMPEPVMLWDFEEGKDPGPREPAYAGFAVGNRARRFAGKGRESALFLADEKELRFGLGETLTIEAWVMPAGSGTPYLIGKGRLGSREFGSNNQNYAVRLQHGKGGTHLGFLFHSADAPGSKGTWHRWWSKEVLPEGGWHHVVVSYTFGQPKSLKALIDGRDSEGTWDMGGATDRAPVTDGDTLVIGSGSSLEQAHSYEGWMDRLAIYRGKVDWKTLQGRYQFTPPPPAITAAEVPKGEVLVQLAEEGMVAANAWPAQPPQVGETYREQVFGFFEVPQKYVESGVRGDRHVPFLLRAAATVHLPKGRHRLLLRARGSSHLYVDGKRLLSTPFPPNDSDGHHKVADQAKYLDLGPDFRFAPPGNREETCELDSSGKPMFVVLESLVGSYVGKSVRRPELGETVVAISLQGSQTWQLLSPGQRQVPYNDAGWVAYERERSAHYEKLNAQRRAEKRAQWQPYWDKRREAAKQYLASSREIKPPALPKAFPAINPIDHFIAERILAQSREVAPEGGLDYHRQIAPLLEARCLECHRGNKAKGDLRLDRREHAFRGGESDGPAIVPGKPNQSALIARVKSADPDLVMPPKGKPLTRDEVALLEQWIAQGARWPQSAPESLALLPPSDDLTFLRRSMLDVLGVVPSLDEIAAFRANPDRRAWIEKLLTDPRWADHWMGYWQDVLAENPNILNPTLNNTGPFRWWLYESLQDNKPMDLMVTELLRMGGSERLGGPAGFATASQNDVPMAAKGTIISAAFLGVEMKCARCHDAPTHQSLQRDLFELAAMLSAKEVEVPKTSSVPMDKLHAGGRKPLISVTLQPGTKVKPRWPFAQFCDESQSALAEFPDQPRDALAALITAPQNQRFAQVMANRIWARIMGRGIVEPVEDWEKGEPSHPQLLAWLGREWVASGYDLKHLVRLILNSAAYQRQSDPALKKASPLFVNPAPKRLEAEQIVDSLFAATGKPLVTEELCLDIDNTRDLKNSINLGRARRSWMLSSTSNERDRPSLALPRIQALSDLLSAFGWRGSRQDPISRRDEDPNVLQPAILSNGTVGVWLTGLSEDHGLLPTLLREQPLDAMLDEVFLRLLTRKPTAQERDALSAYLKPGFEGRVIANPPNPTSSTRVREKYVSWSNHLDGEATLVRQRQEEAARRGDPPTNRLNAEWRQRMEDVLWSLLNSPEWVYAR